MGVKVVTVNETLSLGRSRSREREREINENNKTSSQTIVMDDESSSPACIQVPPLRVRRGNPSHYLRLYFNFCYYVCIIPFRFDFDERRRSYQLRTHQFQKILCLILLAFCIGEEIMTLRELVDTIHYPDEGKDDPLAYFHVFNSLSNFVYYFTLIRTMWCKSLKFLTLMNTLAESESREHYFQDRPATTNPKAKIWISVSLIAFLVYPATYIAGFFLRRSYSGWTEIIDLWSEQAAITFFLENWITGTYFFIKVIFAGLRIAFLLAYTQISTAMELLLIHSAMALYDAVQDFDKMVHDIDAITLTQLLDEYTRLRSISKQLNKAVGLLTFGLTLACLPYYVVNLLEFIRPQNAAVFFRHLMFFGNVFGFLILAVITHKKALVLQDLVLATRNFSDVPIPRLCILLHDMSAGNIGFSGSGFFKVTTGFLGTIISLLLTFSIIIIQFKTSSTSAAAFVNIMT